MTLDENLFVFFLPASQKVRGWSIHDGTLKEDEDELDQLDLSGVPQNFDMRTNRVLRLNLHWLYITIMAALSFKLINLSRGATYNFQLKS